jgi:conjugal transfer pilus assembly protein TraI
MKRLRCAYGADQATFDRDIGALLSATRNTYLLPATPDAYFRGAGGLFRMGLVWVVALQATDGAIFSGARPPSVQP